MRQLHFFRRHLATVTVSNRIATVSLENPPVNVLNRATLAALTDAFQSLPQRRDEVDGIILTSAKPGAFCAGLDLMEFTKRGKTDETPYWEMAGFEIGSHSLN